MSASHVGPSTCSSRRPLTLSPAEQTRMSTRSTASKNARTADLSETSTFTGPRRASAWHVTPSDSNRATIAAPMPLPPPVTTATRPASDSSTEKHLEVCGRALPQLGERDRAFLEREDGLQLAEAGPAAREQVEGALKVAVLVREDAADGVVAAHHAPPRQRCLVGVHADEDRGAGRPEQVERQAACRLRARGVDHHVQPTIDLGRRVDRSVGAQRERVLAARGMPLDDGHDLDTVKQRRLQAREADGPGADDRGALDALGKAGAHGVDAIREGLG